ncbi:hypothetical protein [Actinopolymorpha alba]|uniref:hypothetical protein n=1 Tax=Actinopolymorpha alba TaxID=533267 RepID=UPI000365DF9C|nr:hypothetical protein [Actinopolymorpha alba]
MKPPAKKVVFVDEFYDRDYASDGISRYGAYLRDRAHLFNTASDPLDPVDFAWTAWRIASGPVMSPGYIRVRPDIPWVTCHPREDRDRLVAELEVRLPHPPQVRGLRRFGWADWARQRPWSDDPSPYVEPEENRSTLLFTARFVAELPAEGLPAPQRPGVNVGMAKAAVREICHQINSAVAPDLNRLLAGWREVPR